MPFGRIVHCSGYAQYLLLKTNRLMRHDDASLPEPTDKFVCLFSERRSSQPIAAQVFHASGECQGSRLDRGRGGVLQTSSSEGRRVRRVVMMFHEWKGADTWRASLVIVVSIATTRWLNSVLFYLYILPQVKLDTIIQASRLTICYKNSYDKNKIVFAIKFT